MWNWISNERGNGGGRNTALIDTLIGVVSVLALLVVVYWLAWGF